MLRYVSLSLDDIFTIKTNEHLNQDKIFSAQTNCKSSFK